MIEVFEILITIVLIEFIIIGVIIIMGWWCNNKLGLFEPSINCNVNWDTEFLYNECEYWKNCYKTLYESVKEEADEKVVDYRGNVVGVYFDD